jgi:hypothetical protein
VVALVWSWTVKSPWRTIRCNSAPSVQAIRRTRASATSCSWSPQLDPAASPRLVAEALDREGAVLIALDPVDVMGETWELGVEGLQGEQVAEHRPVERPRRFRRA